MVNVTDKNIITSHVQVLIPPHHIKAEMPATPEMLEQVARHRSMIQNILARKDKRIFGIIGPCSVADQESLLEYIDSSINDGDLLKLSKIVADHVLVVVRLFFAKPRTTVGWKGMFYDPKMDGSHDINLGIRTMRKIVLEVVKRGLPVATEVLDSFMIQYIDDLVSWCAIGARTSESQVHRELASGLSAPVGIKNSVDGSIDAAINGVKAANHPHFFAGMNEEGRVAYLQSKGNPWAHVVLRGGKTGPNYGPEHVRHTIKKLEQQGLLDSILIDCSHDNTIIEGGKKSCMVQDLVLTSFAEQRAAGNDRLVGFLYESNRVGGRQDIPKNGDFSSTVTGKSFTDECRSFEETQEAILALNEKEKITQRSSEPQVI